MATKLWIGRTGSFKFFCGAGMGVSPGWSGWKGLGGGDARWLGAGFGSFSLSQPAGGIATSAQNTATGPVSIVHSTSISDPITTAFTCSGTVTFNLWGWEQSLTANAGWVCRLMRYRYADDSLTLVVESSFGGELSTSLDVYNWTATPTSTDFAVGDRIVLITGFEDAGGTLASGLTVTLRYFGPTADADGDSWIQLSETVSTSSAEPAGDSFYFTDSDSDLDGGTHAKKAMARTRPGSVQTAVTNTVAGPTSPIQITKTAGGTTLEWYTPALDYLTLSGRVYVQVQVLGTAASEGNAGLTAEIARVDGDGTNAVVWGKSICRTGSITSYGTNVTQLAYAMISAPDLSIVRGQRLRLRLFIDEDYAQQTVPMVTGKTSTFRYAGAAASDADSFITLGVSVGDDPGPPGPVSGPFLIPYARV